MTGTDLELHKRTDDWVAMVEPVVDLSNKLAQTPFAGALRGKPADVFACVLYGRELGLSPLQSLQLIDVIQGRPTLSSEGLRSLYLQAGHKIWPVEWTEKTCTVHAERGDGRGAVDITYTISEAERAGLLKNTVWRSFPKQMLLARATAMAIKAIAPDVALGLEAADSPQPTTAPPVGPVSVVQLAPVQAAPEPEPTAPEPAPEPVQVVEVLEQLITGPQLRKLGALIGAWERVFNDGQRLPKEDRRKFISELAERPDLATAKDLTMREASLAIEVLSGMVSQALDAADVVDAEIVEDPA